jgi:hypothetical protein
MNRIQIAEYFRAAALEIAEYMRRKTLTLHTEQRR